MSKTRKRRSRGRSRGQDAKMSVSYRAKILSGGGGSGHRSRKAGAGAGTNVSLVPQTQTRTKKVRAFTKKDFHSGDGMLTTVWGPSMWHFLHTMSFNYPVSPTPDQKRHYMDFILNLRNILPCKYCRMNLTNNLATRPLKMCHMESRDTFSRLI